MYGKIILYIIVAILASIVTILLSQIKAFNSDLFIFMLANFGFGFLVIGAIIQLFSNKINQLLPDTNQNLGLGFMIQGLVIITLSDLYLNIYADKTLLTLFDNNKTLIGWSERGQWSDMLAGHFAVLAFIIAFYTFYMQRQDAKEDAKAAKASADATMFNNRFFELLKMFNDTRDRINQGRENTQYLLTELKEILKPSTDFNDMQNNFLRKYNSSTDKKNFKLFFLNLYQLLKYIKANETQNKDTFFYSNIVRANLSTEELYMLFINCVFIHYELNGDTKFKKLCEDFAMFEHLSLAQYQSYTENMGDGLNNQLLIQYDVKAYGKNTDMINLYNRINNARN